LEEFEEMIECKICYKWFYSPESFENDQLKHKHDQEKHKRDQEKEIEKEFSLGCFEFESKPLVAQLSVSMSVNTKMDNLVLIPKKNTSTNLNDVD